MTLEDVLQHLRKSEAPDVDRHYRDYTRQTTSPDADGFLRYLHDRRLIDTSRWCELLTGGEVEVTVRAGKDVDAAQILRTVGATVSPAVWRESDSTRPPGPRRIGASGSAPNLPAHDSVEEAPAGTRPGGFPPLRYDLLGLLGAGAMGEVHLARDVSLRRKVAFKKTAAEASKNADALTRFLSEAQITSQLDHPNIVPIYGLEVTPDRSLAYAMKLVQGRELTHLIKETRELYDKGQPLDEKHSQNYRLECFLKVCDAIAFAHSRGIIHRDLKPSNIMIGRYNEVYVMDWGISRLMRGTGRGVEQAVELGVDPSLLRDSQLATERTQMGTAIGTPCYMSPEQARGENDDLDGRSDLYTLGLILAELVTLERANQGKTFSEVLANAAAGEKRPLEHHHRSVAVVRELKAVIEKATRVSREDRYQTVDEMAEDLRRFLSGDAVLAQPDSPIQRASRWITKHRAASLGILATTVTLVLGAAATIGTLVYEQGELSLAEEHEDRLGQLLTAVSARSAEINHEIHRYESQLESLAGAARMVLAHAGPSPGRLHFAPDFEGIGTPPADLVPSRYYGRSVSLEWPVYKLSRDADRPNAMNELRKLEWLRPVLQSTVLEIQRHDAPPLEREDGRRTLLDNGAPIHRVFVSLSEGVQVVYPGMAGEFALNDGALIELAKDGSDLQWGRPYMHPQGHGPVLPCVAGIPDRNGRLLGVAGIELTVDYVVRGLLDIPSLRYIEEEMLVDQGGYIVIRERHRQEDLGLLPFAEVREAIQDRKPGFTQINEGRPLLVVYEPIDAIGWYYVVIADAEALLAGAYDLPPSVASWARGS